MLHINEEVQNTNKVMGRIAYREEERKFVRQRDIDLSREIKSLNRQAKAVQRTGDREKIRKFNEIFFNKIGQLTNFRRMQGSNRSREIDAMINEWKANHYVS